MIKLYPPFLYQDGTNDFDEVWENLCQQILKLELKTDNVIKRKPPESGVDLYFPDNKTAYQCKSTIFGTGNGHNLTIIIDSFKQALKIKDSLGWEKYVLCINYDLTGQQEENLKKAIPEIGVLSNSYWTDKVRKYFNMVKDYFRIVLALKNDRISHTISNTFTPKYSEKLINYLDQQKHKIYVWCNSNKSLYDIYISPEFTVEDLLNILINAWPYPLPEPNEIGQYKVGLSYSIVYNDMRQPFNKKLKEIEIKENDIITFWTKITYADNEGKKRSGNYIEMMTINKTTSIMSPEEAIEKYEKEIEESFKKIDEILENEK